jgi:hypothetical protein
MRKLSMMKKMLIETKNEEYLRRKIGVKNYLVAEKKFWAEERKKEKRLEK